MRLAAAAWLLAGCVGEPVGAPEGSGGALAWTPCRLRGYSREGSCADLVVPEDRSRPDARPLTLRIVRYAANARDPEPDPVVFLAGGPGQAATEGLGPIAGALQKLRGTRDLYLVDDRGTGRSSPIPCAPSARDPVTLLGGDSAVAAEEEARLRACRDAFPGDLGRYGTRELVADLDAVREALGVEAWNVWGGSYGTRHAQEYARAHPERVRTLVLDGVVPPSMKPLADAPRGADRAIAQVLADCAADAACGAAYPDLPLRWPRLLARLDAAPLRVTLPHPRTGAPVAVEVRGETAVGLARVLVYVPETAAQLPALLAALDAGDPGPLLAAPLPTLGDLQRMVSPLLQLGVSCAEDVARFGPDDLAVSGVARATALCADWPAGEPVDPARLAPLVSDVPTLLLSGALDPVTPPSGAEEVARTLSRATHVVAAGYGHGVSHLGCAADLVVRFVEDAGPDGFSADCLETLGRVRRPAFLLAPLALSP